MMASRSFSAQVLITFGARVVTALGSIAIMVAAARLLGPTGKGAYSYLVTLVGLGTQLGNFGVGTGNLYFAARDRAATGRLLVATLLVAGVAGAACYLLLLLASAAELRLIPYEAAQLPLIALAIAAGLCWTLGQNLLVGIGAVARYNALAMAYAALLMSGMMAMFALGHQSSSAFAVVMLAAGLTVTFLLSHHLTRGCGHVARFDADLTGRLLRYGFSVYVSQTVMFFLVKSDLFMVQYYRSAEELGLYSVATDALQALLQIQAVVNMLMFPRLAAIEDDKVRLQGTRRLFLRAALAFALVLIVTVPLAGYLVGAVFGESFRPAAPALILIVPGAAALALASILQNHLGASGRVQEMVHGPMAALVVNLALCQWLVPEWGISGAAVASTCGYFVLLAVVVTKTIGVGRGSAAR